MTDGLRVVPTHAAGSEHLRVVFGHRGAPSRCWCRRYKLAPGESFGGLPAEEQAWRRGSRPRAACLPRAGS